jgi:hypothetical protein
MATRESTVELFYDPEELDPEAPRLRVTRNGKGWELRAGEGDLLSKHPSQVEAIEAALERSKARFSEILVRGTTGRAEWVVNQNPEWLKLTRTVDRDMKVRRRRWWDFKKLRFDTGLRLIVRSKRLVAGREPPVKLYYDPEELEPATPRLRISKCAGIWELRDDHGALLSSHLRLPDAVDAALERSEVCFSEILVMGANGRFEWSVRHNPELLEIAKVVAPPIAFQREAAD